MPSIRCVVCCWSSHGAPAFFGCTVECDESQLSDGIHLELARHQASGAGYDVAYRSSDAVVFDEQDGPAWLFENVFGSADKKTPAPETPELQNRVASLEELVAPLRLRMAALVRLLDANAVIGEVASGSPWLMGPQAVAGVLERDGLSEAYATAISAALLGVDHGEPPIDEVTGGRHGAIR